MSTFLHGHVDVIPHDHVCESPRPHDSMKIMMASSFVLAPGSTDRVHDSTIPNLKNCFTFSVHESTTTRRGPEGRDSDSWDSNPLDLGFHGIPILALEAGRWSTGAWIDHRNFDIDDR